jgi:hypothetical protein
MSAINLLDLISLAGCADRPNEDRAGLAGRHAWVIDGATGLGEPLMGGASDAAWLAQRCHEAFTRHADVEDPAELLSRSADDLVASFEAERRRSLDASWELPCGAFMLASWRDGGLDLSWSADCRAIVETDGGILLSFGASALSEEAEAALVARLGQGGDPARRYREPAALEALREQRGVALAPARSIILCPDRGFLEHLGRARISARRLRLLLMTDGFAAAELRYGLHDGPRALMAAAAAGGLQPIAAALRRFEAEVDPDCMLRPRWKRSDDATALRLEISA